MSAIASLVLCLAAQAERSEWELFRGLYEHGLLELHTADPALADALRARIAPRQGTLPLETRVVGPGDASDARASRVVFARLGGPAWEAAAELAACPSGAGPPFLSLDEHGFRVGHEAFAEAGDAFLLTREDPERPGRPVSIVVGGRDAGLAALYDLERPAWRGALDIWRAGHPWSRTPMRPWSDGWSHDWLGNPTYLEPIEWQEWERSFASLRSFATLSSDELLELRSGNDLGASQAELESARAYDAALHVAGARARRWLGARGPPRPPLSVRLVHPSSAPGLLARTLARPFDGEDGVYALSAAGQRDDGGAAFALACALAEAGEPAQLWLRDALGVAAARTWWGRPLEGWVGHLASAGLSLPVHELVDPSAASRHSVHRLAPLRGFLFLALLARGRDGAELWRRGLSSAEAEAFEADFAAGMRDRASAHMAERSLASERSVMPPLRGLALDLAGLDHRRLEDPDFKGEQALAFARSQGADAISFSVLAPLDEPPHGVARTVGASASASDVELSIACDAARALGLRTALVLEPLAAPASVRADAVARTLPEDWEDFFERYERVALHYALLAELLGCELYCFGVDLPFACDVESFAGHARKREIKRERWDALVARLRAAYGGRLTYAAESVSELERLPFAERLDLFATLFFPRLELEGEPDLAVLEAELQWRVNQMADAAQRLAKPLVLLQAGFASCERAWESPLVPGPRADPELQALLYRAFARVLQVRGWHEPWFGGLFLWELGLQPAEAGNRGFRAWGKPAEAFLPAVLGR